MAVKSLHQFFYYPNKYLNSMKCRGISMDPSIHIIQCRTSARVALKKGFKDNSRFLRFGRTIRIEVTYVIKLKRMHMWQ
jgi:hypothetical protein